MRFCLSYIVDMHGDYVMAQVDVDRAIGDNPIHGLLDYIIDMLYGQVKMGGMMWMTHLTSNRHRLQCSVN